MRWSLVLLVAACAASLTRALAQDQVPVPIDSSQSRTPPEPGLFTAGLPRKMLRAEGRIWSFPLRAANHPAATLAVASATIGLIALDPHISPHFSGSEFDRFKRGILTKGPMAVMIVGIPAVTYTSGFLMHDSYAKETGALAIQAAAHGFIVSTIVKAALGRRFPAQIPNGGDFGDTWFKFTGSAHDPGSFPSSHAASAFAAAAVYSSRYHHRRWAPIAAYGLAALASFTRIPDQTHFPSDVFFGAAVGYAIGHFVVVAPH